MHILNLYLIQILLQNKFEKEKKLVVFSFFKPFICFSIVFTIFDNNKFIEIYCIVSFFISIKF
jgi:hypothetical protein